MAYAKIVPRLASQLFWYTPRSCKCYNSLMFGARFTPDPCYTAAFYETLLTPQGCRQHHYAQLLKIFVGMGFYKLITLTEWWAQPQPLVLFNPNNNNQVNCVGVSSIISKSLTWLNPALLDPVVPLTAIYFKNVF